MTWLYLLGAILAVLLLAYLTVALLLPEKFS
jgi:K+-transporting ATPase KdpF subunit